ncbi:MAG: FAD-binding oxidoreductase [Acidiferrobacterales bacterium]|nr:FAD-binding oxidoreductase [Acidiferrobacterales bacterium]
MNYKDRQTADSYYEASRSLTVQAPQLEGAVKADVVVIGGGLTGSSTALCLAEKGVSVALVESRHFGWGASGRSGGQIINGYAAEQSTLEKLVGFDTARELWDHSLAAVEFTRERIIRHQIPCDYESGYLHVGVKKRHAAELEEWIEHLDKKYDYSVMSWHDKQGLAEILGSDLYCGGVSDPGSGHLHPLNYSLGMSLAAQQAGASLFENSPVLSVTPSTLAGGESGYLVRFEKGEIRCEQVVYACNAYLDNLEPDLRKQIMPVGTYIVATEPLGESTARGLISNNAAVSDTNFVLDYYRCSADHRMLFGGRVSYSTLEPRKLSLSLEKRMLRVFPQLAGTKIDYAWGGFVAITRNRAPHIGRLPGGQLFAQGFSGHGMALTGYVGSLLANAVMGDHATLQCYEQIPHQTFPGGPKLRTPALVAAMAYHRLLDYR